jgi:Flp pilus assembly protein TadG
MALTAAMVTPCVFAVILGGVDYISVANQRVLLQSVADRAALASAQELVVANSSQERISAVAAAYVEANYAGAHTTSTQVTENGKAVKVSLTAEPQAFMNSPFASGGSAVIVEAVAEVSGGGNICVIGLNPAARTTISMGDSARLTAGTCVVYSNAPSPSSLSMKNNGVLTVEFACIAGGVMQSGTGNRFPRSMPVTDCPGIDDPLKNRPAPNFDSKSCDYTATTITTPQTLSPGIYCGGLTVSGGAKATLSPGTYIIKDGLLSVGSGGELSGDHVGFFLTGPGAPTGIFFQSDSTISLSAPTKGDMAGLLLFEDRNNSRGLTHTIASQRARKFEGTIYLPKYGLTISGRNTIADQSDFTILIANTLSLAYGPNVVLNTNYSDSDVPVPDGVGNMSPGGKIILSR